MAPFPLDPTPVHVPDEVLTDLQRRLELTRWPDDAGNQDWHYGVSRTYLQELLDYVQRRPGLGPQRWPAHPPRRPDPRPQIGTSIRTYANNNRYPWTPSHDRRPAIEAPTGITFVGYENPPGVRTDR
ncbi:MAG TPA: epoxide hydrolase N-terminal domain-containing protein, partial [Actinomycetes bacterium]|nr:epoxide hydrolase N-terminal domain-containing protein [Actinomycetes bacterium]